LTCPENAKIELHSYLYGIMIETLMSKSKYWPMDMDNEGQIYDNVAWDLPGFCGDRSSCEKSKSTRRRVVGREAKPQAG
jgi:hypothetical protein